jgi:hypothetical protein
MRRDWTFIGIGLAAAVVAGVLVAAASTQREACETGRTDVAIDGYDSCRGTWHGWHADAMTLAPLILALIVAVAAIGALAYGLRPRRE